MSKLKEKYGDDLSTLPYKKTIYTSRLRYVSPEKQKIEDDRMRALYSWPKPGNYDYPQYYSDDDDDDDTMSSNSY